MNTYRQFKAAFILVIIVGLFISTSFSTVHAASSTLIEGAKKEGKVIWYTTMPVQDVDRLLKGFAAQYPYIKIEILRLSAVSLRNKVLAEARMKKHSFDVVSIGIDAFYHLLKQGLIAKYNSPERKSYHDDLKDREGYWTGFYQNTHVIAYNTKLVSPSDVPHSYEDLLSPKWKNKKLALDNKDWNWFAAQLEIMGREKGLEFGRRLANQNLYLRPGKSLLVELLIAQEFQVAVNVYGSVVEVQKKKGAPVEWVPVEPVVRHVIGMMLASHAKNPNSAKLFIDYALSREAQILTAMSGRLPCRSDVPPDPPRLTEGLKFHMVPEKHISENNTQVAEDFVNIFRK